MGKPFNHEGHEGSRWESSLCNLRATFVSFVVIALFPAGAVHKAPYAIFQMYNIEVYKQSDGFTTELEVRKDFAWWTRETASTDLISTTTRSSANRSMR
jgi:hypothetical protein